MHEVSKGAVSKKAVSSGILIRSITTIRGQILFLMLGLDTTVIGMYFRGSEILSFFLDTALAFPSFHDEVVWIVFLIQLKR